MNEDHRKGPLAAGSRGTVRVGPTEVYATPTEVNATPAEVSASRTEVPVAPEKTRDLLTPPRRCALSGHGLKKINKIKETMKAQ